MRALVSRRLVPLGAQACGQRWGCGPVFVDGTGIEVEGKLCENAGRHGCARGWAGAAGPGGRQPVGLRAASADSCQDLASYCRRKGWEYSVSVTDPRQKAPILRLVDARGLREDEGEPLDAAGKERAIVVAYRPARWPEEQVYVVIRRGWDGEQRLLEPVCMAMLVSHDRLPLAELVRPAPWPAGAGECVPGAVDGPGLHHPPCRSQAANQGFYLGGQIALLLLRLLQYQALPAAARQPGLRPLIRYCVGSVGRLTRSARRLRLLCSRSNLQWDWLLHAASRREPG